MAARKKVIQPLPLDDPGSSSSSSDELPLPTPTAKIPKPSSSESDTESGSQAESEPHVTPTKGKALAAQAQKPKAQPSPAPLIFGCKRAAENNNVTEPISAKRKSLRSSSVVVPTPVSNEKTEEDEKKSGDGAAENNNVTEPISAKRKSLRSFSVAVAAPVSDEKTEEDGKKSGDVSKPRRWSKEAEITFMKGLVDFTSKTGMRLAASNALLLYMRGLLGDELTKNQLKDKVKTMKKKFQRVADREKNGDPLNFLKPHDHQVYDLWKKAWGNPQDEFVVEKPESDGNVAEGPSKNAKSENKPEKKFDHNDCIDLLLSECKEGNVLDEEHMKRGWELIDDSKRAKLNARFKKLQDLKMKLFVGRVELISDLTKLLAEALRSHN